MADVRVVEVSESLTIEVTTTRAWTAMIERFDAWWSGPLRSPDCQAAQFDHRVGGQAWEDHGSGAGRALGTVREIRAGERVVLDGAFGLPGALAGWVTLTLTPAVVDDPGERSDGGCVVEVTQRAMAEIDDEALESFRTGWREALTALGRIWSATAPG